MINGKNFRFRMNTEMHVGPSISQKLPDLISNKSFKKPYVILDHNLSKNKEINSIIDNLKSSFSLGIFVCKVAEPDYDYLDLAKKEISSSDMDCLIAIGGGSVMDLSKGLAVLLKNQGPAINFKGFPKNIEHPIPVITVPTLAGTGSEIAYNAVFTDSKKRMRLGINTELNYPVLSVIDSKLTLTAPKNPVLFGILDCLNHIVEGYISPNSSSFTKEISKSAFTLWYKSVKGHIIDFHSIKSREEMYLASILANMALNNVGSGLGGDFSYPLGAKFSVPHGLGEGIFLPYLYRLYVDRGFEGFSGLFDSLSIQEESLSLKDKNSKFCSILSELYSDLEIPKNLNGFEISKTDIPELVDSVRSSFTSAPVSFSESDAIKLFDNFIL